MRMVGVAKGTLNFIQSILRILQGSMQVYIIANAVIHSDYSNSGDKIEDKKRQNTAFLFFLFIYWCTADDQKCQTSCLISSLGL